MKEIERHIESLLLRNDCVIVPDLGGFVAHHVDARYSEEEYLFLPPTRMLGFNPQLTMNDSLLVQSYADTYDLSYPEALGRVEQEVAALRSALDEEGHCELEGLGTLYKNQEGKLSFAPCEAGILTPSLYALDSFEVKPLETAAKSEAEEEKTQAVVVTRDEENGQRRVSVSLKFLRHAAMAACVLAICIFVISPMGVQRPENNYKVQSAMWSCLYENPAGEAAQKPMKLTVEKKKPTATPVATQKQVWTIVLCTHVPMSGAKTFCQALKDQGYEDTRVVDHQGSIKVVYGSYDSKAQAREALQGMKPDRYFNTAWILNIEE